MAESNFPWRRHQMEACSAWGESTGRRWIPITKTSDEELWYFSLICAWRNGWASNRDAGDCPACRTYLIATRFWVVVICPIIKCLTVLEFSFILFDLCLFITIFNFILNYVLIVTFWIFTYHKIWILLIIFCFIWNYWIIYFFNMFGSVLECCELTGVSLLWPWLIKWK